MRHRTQDDLDYESDVADLRRQRRAERRWQDDRDDDLEAPDVYPDPEPEHPYTPTQS